MSQFEATRLTRPSTFNFASDVVDYWAAKSPPLQAMHWISQTGSESRIFDYQHFSRQSHRVASLLEKLGVQRGETLLVILPRIPAWWEIALAAIRSGVILCPTTTLLVDHEIEYRCQRTGATAFLGDESSVQKFLNVRQRCPSIRTVIQADGTLPEGVIDLQTVLKDVSSDAIFKQPNMRPEEPALIYFTSGTSDGPKMVLHNQISYPLAHTITGKYWLRLSPGKLYWNLSEQGWAKAAWSLFGTWNCGASLFVHDDRQSFSPIRLLEILHKYPITTLCGPPTVYRQLILKENQKFFRNNPPRALEHCTGAGEPLNDEVIRQWERMSGIAICDGYGQTETILICGNFEGYAIRPGSMGVPSPGVPLAIVDDRGYESAVGQEGDIGILMETKGVNADSFFGIYDGYVGDDGRVRRQTRTFERNGGGSRTWYLTGDRATRDKDGYFWFVGRSDDVVNSAGYRIGPFEVESTLKQHPAVVESAVVASPDWTRGEVVKAYVVLTTEYASRDYVELARELQDFCKENAAPYKYPRKIQFVDASFLPKTNSGKIKRSELKRLEWVADPTEGVAMSKL